MLPFVNDQPPDLLTDIGYLATTSGSGFGYGVTDASTMGLPSGVFDPYPPIPFQTTPLNPLDQTAFDPGHTAGPSTIMAQGLATVRGRKRALPREDGKDGSRKRRKGPITNQLAPSGSGVPAAHQETTAQATFTAMPRP